ncbi:MAG: hypothetical protein JW810_03080, partial [Sedimentisphaerales bacterium]|nr:hypothetical protein [Sedimentisphaerales bacterium]
TSKENQLFARLYNVSADLPGHNIMNRLIRAIRSGELDLAPAADGGWYDYQMFALETLLVPEKGQEGDKLLLSEDYKKRLIDAFKTMLTKKRELHVRHIEFVPARCMVLGPEYFSISPDLHVEPMATYCLRTARGFRFLLDGLETILGSSSLEGIVVDGSSLPAALEEMASLYYGLYLQICEDIGMRPQFLPDEMTDAQEAQARGQTEQWLLNYEKESFCQKDVRYIVPALTNLEGTRVRYWMVVGVALLKIRADYARRPQVQIINAETAEILQRIPTDAESGRIMDTYLRYRYGSEEYFLPVEVFAEATGPAEPLTREEFRRLCDRCRDKDKIIAAIESRAAFTILRVVIIALLAFLLGAAVLVLVHLVKRKRSASPLPPGENETAGDEHRGG